MGGMGGGNCDCCGRENDGRIGNFWEECRRNVMKKWSVNMLYYTVQCSVVMYSTVLYIAERYCIVQCNTFQYITVQYNTVQ